MLKIKLFGVCLTSESIRHALEAMVRPKWLALIFVFLFLYIPFILDYGWGYRSIKNVDLPSFYAASVRVFVDGRSPYNLEFLQTLFGSNTRVFPYLYPPPSLLAFFPLSFLTYEEARHAVLIINHLLFLLVVWTIPLYLLRPPLRYDSSLFNLCFAYSLTFWPVIVTLNHGQINILLLSCLVLFWLFARNGKNALAGVFLALSVLLKTYPLIFIPLLVLIGRWRECAYMIAWLGLATIVSFVVLPNAVWEDWLGNVMPTGGYTRIPDGLFSPAAIYNQNINGFFARLFTESQWSHPILVNTNLARILTYGTAGLVAIITAIAVWRCRNYNDSLDRMILIALPAMYLVAPFSWEHHLVYILPSILILLNSRYLAGFTPKAIFYSLCLVSAIVINVSRMLPYKFYGVACLWALCIFLACNENVILPNKRMDDNEQ